MRPATTPMLTYYRWRRSTARFALACVVAGLASLVPAVAGPVPRASASASEHTATLSPSHIRAVGDWGADDPNPVACLLGSDKAAVGYYHYVFEADVFEADYWDNCVYELAVRFDLDEIHQHPGAVITRAELQYDEQPTMYVSDADGHSADPATVGGAQSQGYESCVWQVWVPSQNWTAWPDDHRGLVPADEDPLLTRLGTTRWDVTNEANFWYFHSASDPDKNFGLVLRGYDEQIKFENNAACVSDVSNFKLVVTYVADDPAPAPTPNLAQRAGQAGRAGVVSGLGNAIQDPDLVAVKIDGPQTVKDGVAQTYQAVIRNDGSATNGMEAQINFSGALEAWSMPPATAAGMICTEKQVPTGTAFSCKGGTIGAGQTVTVQFRAHAAKVGGGDISVVLNPNRNLPETNYNNDVATLHVTVS